MILAKEEQYGQAFTYDSLSKNGSRPIIYSAIGTHDKFRSPRDDTRIIDTLDINDNTSPGPIWDPTLSAYYYTYAPSSATNGIFTPSDASFPIGWLLFEGQWGDEQYPDSDPRQVNFLNVSIAWKYESGPTGPIDKDLNRTDVCPKVSGTPCTTLSVLPATSGSSIPVTVTRTTSFQSSLPTGSGGGNATLTRGAGSTGSSTSAAGSSPSGAFTGGTKFLEVNVQSTVWMALVALLI